MSATQNTPAALVQRGQEMRQRGDASGATRAFGEALARDRLYWPALLERGMLRLDSGEVASALQDLRACAQLAPSQPRVWLYLGNAENAGGDADAALKCFRRALEHGPGFAQAHYNCGVIHFHAGRLAAAAEAYSAAIAHEPDFVMAHSNLGVALEAMGASEAAEAAYDTAAQLDPNHASPRWNKALLQLRNGRYVEGWRLYEWRWAAGKGGPFRQFTGRPLWLGGRNLAGRTVLLHAEQGIGDAIQFARYAPLVAALGARVILEVFTPLVELCKSLAGVSEVVGAGDKLPKFDFHCPLMSLPLALGTDEKTIPGETPYLAAPEERRAAWAAKLGPAQRRRIAFAWKGNPKHEGDAMRSVPLDLFARLFGAEAEFIWGRRQNFHFRFQSNNYAISSRICTEQLLRGMKDHVEASAHADRLGLTETVLPFAISATVKTPCAASVVGGLVADKAAFIRDMAAFAARFAAPDLPDPMAWLRDPLAEIAAMFGQLAR